MKRIMLIGPSQCGKTSLTQCMRGEVLHYQKTQAIVWSPTTIDTPGEYLENRCLYSALLASACEADIIALVLNADAPWSPFSPGFTGPMNRPVIGLVKVFVTSALENTGVDEMFIFLNAKEPSCLTK